MSIESSIIRENVKKLKTNLSKVFVTPSIPEKKLSNALEAYAAGVQPEDVLALVDSTLLGNAKEGLLFTKDEIYFSHNSRAIDYLDIQDVELIQKQKQAKNIGRREAEPTVVLSFSDGTREEFDEYLPGVSRRGFYEFIKILHGEQVEIDSDSGTRSQVTPLAMMSDEIKELYLKFLCNTAYFDDEQIDSREYAELMILIVINALSKESRRKIRSYILNSDELEPMNAILDKLSVLLTSDVFNTVKYSLFKDAINIRWDALNPVENKNAVKEDSYINSLQEVLEINDTKAQFIIDDIQRNKDILSMRQDDNQIQKGIKETAARASAVGVPMAAVYLSGSVIGVSASGITSGLAALGMGGLLGFSSMVTGIGVAVLLGVGTYRGVRRATGLDNIEKSKEREMMLREVAVTAQKSMNYLVEDINDVNDQLAQVVSSRDDAVEKVKRLSLMLAKVRQMGKAAQYTSEKMSFATREELICKLPHSINMGVIEQLAPGEENAAIRELLMKVYSRQEVDDKQQIIANCLDENCSEADLSNALRILRSIGFFKTSENAVASVKNAADSGIKEVKNRMKGKKD